MPAELRRHLRRQVPAAAMVRDREGIGFTLLGFGFEVADRLIAIVSDARQFQIDGFAPGAGAGPFAEQSFGRGVARGQRLLEGHQTATEQQERQGDHNDTPGFHSTLPLNTYRFRRSCRRLRSFDLALQRYREGQDQKIAAFGSSYRGYTDASTRCMYRVRLPSISSSATGSVSLSRP
ncbi:hypothetical protein D3C84_790860 [compost metagenome]